MDAMAGKQKNVKNGGDVNTPGPDGVLFMKTVNKAIEIKTLNLLTVKNTPY